MTFASVTLPSVAVRWVLSGPAGAHLDALVSGLIGAGVTIEPIVAGERYRIDGGTELLDVLAGELAPVEGFALVRETPPTDTINMRTTATPSHPFRRSVTVHGIGAAPSFVARAVDRRLTVTPAGASRWEVSGRTAALVDWLAAIYAKTTDEVLALFGWTPESVAAEDTATPAVDLTVTLPPVPVQVNVTLPDRRTTSEIKRDAAGDLVQFIQLETSV